MFRGHNRVIPVVTLFSMTSFPIIDIFEIVRGGELDAKILGFRNLREPKNRSFKV